MVDHTGRCNPVIALAVDAQGVSIEVNEARLLPCITVATLG